MNPNDLSIYDKGLVQLHDRGIVRRMVEVSGDPSADLPPAVDIASPATPVMDITRYASRSLLLHGPTLGGTLSGSYQFNIDMDLINDARAFQVESVVWKDAFTGTTHSTWYELVLGAAFADQTFSIPLMAYFGTLSGAGRTVHVIAEDYKVNKAKFDKPYVYNQATTQDPSESYRATAITFQWERLSGAGVPNIVDLVVACKLYY